jgi:ABC-type nitrate/sulfonate/bicarbonate transport system substrate-binding protein
VVVPLAPEQAPGALERREVDAVAVWEPYAFMAVRALGADATVLAAPRVYTQTFNLVARRPVLAEREGDLVKLLRALERAERFIRERPGDAQALLKAKLQLGQDYIDWDWSNHEFRLGLAHSLLGTLDGEARWAQREGHVPADRPRPNFLQVLEPGPLSKAVPGAVTVTR